MASESSVLVRMRMLGAAAMARDSRMAARALGGIDGAGKGAGRALDGMGRSGGVARTALGGIQTAASGAASGLSFVESGVRRVVTITSALAAAATTAAAVTGASYNRMQDNQRVAFTAMTGSAEEAERIMQRIRNLSEDSPILDPGNTGLAIQRLMAYGLTAEAAFLATERIGDSAVASGRSIDEVMPRAALAIGQIQSKGKLSAEELNQLAESISVGRGAVARELGMSGAELEEALRRGEISAAEGLPAVFRAMEKQSRGAAKMAAEATAGELDRLREVLGSAAGTLTRPFYDAFGDFAGALAERLGTVNLESFAQRLFGVVQGIAARVATIAGLIDWQAVVGGLRSVVEWAQGQVPRVQALVAGVVSRIPAVVEGITSAVRDVIEAVRPAMPFVENVLVPLLRGVLIGAIASLIAAFKVAVPIIGVLARALGWIGEKAAPLSGLIEKVGMVIGFVFAGQVVGVLGLVARSFAAVGGVVGKLGTVLSVAFKLWTLPLQILGRLVAAGVRGFGRFAGAAAAVGRALDRGLTFVRRYVGFMGGLPGQIGRIAVNMVGRFVNGIGRMPGAAMGAARRVVAAFGRVLGGLPGRIWTAMSGAARELGGGRVLQAMLNAAGRIGRAIVDAIVQVIRNSPGAIAGAIGSIVPGPIRDVVGLAGGLLGRGGGNVDRAAASQAGLEHLLPGGTRAFGGSPRGLALVGEHGPELARFGPGSSVQPHARTRSLLDSAGRGMRSAPMLAHLVVNLDGRTLHRQVHRVERRLAEAR